MEEKLNKFLEDNQIHIMRGNFMKLVKVKNYQHLLELVKTNPRGPIKLNESNLNRLHDYIEKLISCTDSRIVYTLFDFCTFGINYPNFGMDLLYKYKKQ